MTRLFLRSPCPDSLRVELAVAEFMAEFMAELMAEPMADIADIAELASPKPAMRLSSRA